MPEKIVSTTKQVLTTSYPMLWRLAGRNYNFIRLAGLSGASAVILGAIGSHELVLPEKGELRTVFETANRFHFFHSIALLGVPSTKHPVVVSYYHCIQFPISRLIMIPFIFYTFITILRLALL